MRKWLVQYMRAKTVPHVEYEIFNLILDEIDLTRLKEQMVPTGDTVAEERFNRGAESASKLIQNLVDRRLHRLPKNHADYEEKK